MHSFSVALAGVTSSGQSSVKKTSDEALIRLISSGDRDAMRLLFARHNVRVFRFLKRMVGNDATAEDLLSEVFLEVWRSAGRFDARSQVSTWILGIARYKALSSLRQRSFDELDQDSYESVEDPADDPEISLQKKQDSTLLQECLKQLSAAHREVLDLIYYHEQSIEDVARIIGVPPGTVKTRAFHARKRVAELMAERGVQAALA
jgi:RNA polymerase sigma-70 factor (ECF subfamily)